MHVAPPLISRRSALISWRSQIAVIRTGLPVIITLKLIIKLFIVGVRFIELVRPLLIAIGDNCDYSVCGF